MSKEVFAMEFGDGVKIVKNIARAVVAGVLTISSVLRD